MITYYHYFRYKLFNVVHDQIITELNNRIAERSTQLLRWISCHDRRNLFANFGEEKLVELAKLYDDDLCTYEISFVLRNHLETFITDVSYEIQSYVQINDVCQCLVQFHSHDSLTRMKLSCAILYVYIQSCLNYQ